MNRAFVAALDESYESLADHLSSRGPRGLEHIIRDRIAAKLGSGAETEVSYSKVGGRRLYTPDPERAHIDICVDGTVGLELKVVAMPRIGSTGPNQCLYDIGQISADFCDLESAANLLRAQIVILAYGPLVTTLRTRPAIARELHNRFFVDYQTSLQFGELGRELRSSNKELRQQRKRQVQALKRLGVTSPHHEASGLRTVAVKQEFAIVTGMVK